MIRRLRENRLVWAGPCVVFAVSLLFFGWLFAEMPVLYDTDSYYHLAVARAYAHEGPIDTLPWARFSLMHDGFGDKEFLFHVLLAPFAASPDPTVAAAGGRWGLALFNALLASTLALFGILAVGRWGLVVPWLVYAGSADFLGRVVRLRPEILSLLLLLAAVACAARGRDRLLGLVAAAYTLSYTAFHALLGLCFAWFLARGWNERRWTPNLLLYPVLGALVGLLIHPNFPHNLAVWKVQSVDYFLRKAELNVGIEITPATMDELLWLNLGWVLGLAALALAARLAAPRPAGSTAWILHVATAVFGLLYLLAQRFSIYFVPLATLSLIYELRRRGLALSNWVELPGRGRLPLVLVLAAASAVGLGQTATLAYGLARAGTPAEIGREAEWAAFGRAVPPAARVAAEWGSTHLYMFWAPQATYLNVLDPVFMALPFPRAYEKARDVFEGREPDIPVALESALASRFLALSTFHPHRDLLRRLIDDPRLAPRYRGYTSLFEILPGENADFLLDWRKVPPGLAVPPPPDTETSAFEVYPRAPEPEERRLEAFVDAGRFGEAPACVALVHDVRVPEPAVHTYELAPYGPSSVWLDQRLLVSTHATPRAVLGAGLRFPAALQGKHQLTVLTCPGQEEESKVGFFLRRPRE